MQRLPVKRLQALEERRARERPFRFVWTRRDATDAEIKEACNRLIAAGRARRRPFRHFLVERLWLGLTVDCRPLYFFLLFTGPARINGRAKSRVAADVDIDR
jgi:hypothetical protein